MQLTQKQKDGWVWAWIVLAGLLVVARQKGCDLSGIGAKPTAVVYVWRKDDGPIPSEVRLGISQLNEQDVLATDFEVGTVDGENQVPDQYKAAADAATKEGLPCLVSVGGENHDKILKLVKAPTTATQVTEIIK